MLLRGFIGPSYVGRSKNVAAETLFNWYAQRVEADEPQQVVYYPRPGKPVFAELVGSPLRALFSQDGRCVAVAGQTLYELFDNAAPVNRGTLTAVDGNPATITSNGTAGHQLYITSGGRGDIFDLSTNTLASITAAGYPVNTPMGTYLDTYFLTIEKDTAQFNISAVDDGTNWSALDFAIRVAGSDNLVGIIQFNKVIWLIGSLTSERWYNSGATFPFQAVPQVLLEMGCCAPFSIVRTSVAVCWLHQSERGQGIFVAVTDYTPRRLSTFAVEAIWQTYPTITDAVAYALTWEGHEWVVLNFPEGNATWVYDFNEQLWHQWSWWNPVTGAQDRDRGWVHCHAFGRHLVGDWETGTVYSLDPDSAVDGVDAIVWERSSPHLKNELITNFYGNFQLDTETGLGGSTPTAQLSWSSDGGHTYGSARDMELGAAGQFNTRCRVAGGLGSDRDRNFRVRISNDVPPSGVMAAYVDVMGGTG